MKNSIQVIFEGVTRLWDRVSLTARFALVTSVIIFVAMLVVGHWTADGIQNSIVENRAAAAVLRNDNIVQPQVQSLRNGGSLRQADKDALDRMMSPPMTGTHAIAFRIWSGDTVVHSSRRNQVGEHFAPSESRQRAMNGEIVAQAYQDGDLDRDYTELQEDEGLVPSTLGDDGLLEIYAPVRETDSQRIIAVAETYERVPGFGLALKKARTGSWVLIGLVGVAMLAVQSTIVHGASLIIYAQRTQLNSRVATLTQMLKENGVLRSANRASLRASEMNEQFLRKIAADLHDGPVQLIGMAMLRLDVIKETLNEAELLVKSAISEDDINIVQDALDDTLKELRGLSNGLMLPEIEYLNLADTLQMAATRHERRTRTTVDCELGEIPNRVPRPVKYSLYRFVQEGLNNSFLHAKGSNSTVTARSTQSGLEVSVSDNGPGFDNQRTATTFTGLGLHGLRERIEALGGQISIETSTSGTRLTAVLSDLDFLQEEQQA